MPAGDLLTMHSQFELRATLLGRGTNIKPSRRTGIGGLGSTPVKSHDLPLTAATGSYGGEDEGDVRVVTIPFYMDGATAEAAYESLVNDTTGTWRRSDVDLPLHMWLPTIGRCYVNGRPRGVEADLSQITFGLIEVLCTFETTVDPTLYFL